MFERLKLKHQLYFLVILTLILFMLFSCLYYFSFRQITYSRAEDTAQQMIDQVSQNVISMTDSIESSANGLIYYNTFVQELLVSDDRVRNLELYEYLEQMVGAMKASNTNIYSITWLSNDMRMISDPVRDDNDIVTTLLENYDFTSEDFTKPVFSTVIPGQNESFNYFAYIFPVYSLKLKSMPKIGCGIIVLNVFELENLVRVSRVTENSLFAILDQENNVVVSNRELQTGDVYENVFWDDSAEATVKTNLEYNGMESIAQCSRIEGIGWKIVSIIPMSELSSDMQSVVRTAVLLAVFGCIVLLTFGLIIVRNITKPIQNIVDFLRGTQNDTLKQRIELREQNEIGIIASNINSMLDRVEQVTTEMVDNQALLYEAKLAEQDAELVALQSQINPHFLYNTLNCISNIGLAYDIPEVSDISVAMSNIYRYSIKGDNIVRLADELKCIKEYMRIMDIRFGGKFETEYRFDDRILDLYTLRMILQPIVENAVYHGMELSNRKGRLLIEGKIDNNRLVLIVKNDGKGMSAEKLGALRKAIRDYESVGLYNAEKTSIGLSNINKRVKLQFGTQYGMYIESEEAVGTKVALVLPIIRER